MRDAEEERPRPAEDLVERIVSGDEKARATLFEIMYEELKALASGLMARERPNHTLQPTALVNDVYRRLVHTGGETSTAGRFKALAAKVMREALVDHARAHRTLKRGEGRATVTLTGVEVTGPVLDPLDLEEALLALRAQDPVLERIVELRYFAGLSLPQVATELGLAEWVVKRKWPVARILLSRHLRPEAGEP
jgi:RNA polymerase sigma-70 factor (ECF subfamily)